MERLKSIKFKMVTAKSNLPMNDLVFLVNGFEKAFLQLLTLEKELEWNGEIHAELSATIADLRHMAGES